MRHSCATENLCGCKKRQSVHCSTVARHSHFECAQTHRAAGFSGPANIYAYKIDCEFFERFRAAWHYIVCGRRLRSNRNGQGTLTRPQRPRVLVCIICRVFRFMAIIVAANKLFVYTIFIARHGIQICHGRHRVKVNSIRSPSPWPSCHQAKESDQNAPLRVCARIANRYGQ